MNAVLLLTLCLLGMAVAQDHLWTALGRITQNPLKNRVGDLIYKRLKAMVK